MYTHLCPITTITKNKELTQFTTKFLQQITETLMIQPPVVKSVPKELEDGFIQSKNKNKTKKKRKRKFLQQIYKRTGAGSHTNTPLAFWEGRRRREVISRSCNCAFINYSIERFCVQLSNMIIIELCSTNFQWFDSP